MLITRLICILIYNARSVCSLTIKILTEIFTFSKVINTFKQYNSWPDLFQKNSTSFTLIFPKLSSQNKLKHGVVTCHDSYLQFPQSLLGTPTTRPPFWHVHKKKKRREMLASKTIIDPHFV